MGGPPAAIIIVRSVNSYEAYSKLHLPRACQTSSCVELYRVWTDRNCRHGTRLDSADPKWHLTSPTPYDTPLTYGGWTQSKALGAKIANVLQTLDERANEDGEVRSTTSRKKRKHKVVIHTSPFLRCIQTSVGIAAGLATNATHAQQPTPIKQMHSDPFRHSPTLGARSNKIDSPRLEPIPEPMSSPPVNFSEPAQQPPKALLRIDAFLGEWLSPDYFMQITPPPSSVLMVASAKADLLRREDYAHLSYNIPMPTSGFPGGWGNIIPPDTKEQDLPSVPFTRDRTSSMSSAGSSGSGGRPRPFSRGHGGPHNSDSGTYVPPVPHYAISMTDPIPPGYVCHTKDAAVTVDYQWDSMREPENWGDGGEYGEEWSSMHKRVRKGVAKLIDFYRDPGGGLTTPSRPSSSGQGSNTTNNNDDDALVVVLVSHGACCNALIGAITNQPVLMDVGMTHLTMAVRKSPSRTPFASPRTTPAHSRNASRQMGLSDEYELILQNSAEHLRRSSTASIASQAPQPIVLPFRPFLSRDHAESNSSNPFIEPITLGEPVRTSFTSAGSLNLGGLRRSVSVASGSGSSSSGLTYTPNYTGSIGLWAPPRRLDEEEQEEGTEGDDMVLNFAEEREAKASQPPSPDRPKTPKVDKFSLFGRNFETPEKGKDIEKPERSDSAKTADGKIESTPRKPSGLWPGPKPPGELGTMPERVPGTKRRWTITEQPMH